MNFRNILLSALATLFTLGIARGQTNADGTYTVPIYANPTNFSPSHYTIYASFGSGPLLPYLFDTGAPYLLSFYNNTPDVSTNGQFTFSMGLTYFYNEINQTVSLGNNAGQTNVTTANPVNLGQVNFTNADINSPGSPTLQVTNPTAPQGDGTYGDFGAGFYGSNAFATVLAQLPLDASLKQGYTLDMTTSATQGSLTLGLAASALAALSNAPGAIVMALSPSGALIPTATNPIPGYNKAQVGAVDLGLTKDGVTTNTEVPFVLDTGGGPNAVIYATNLTGFGGATNMVVSSTNGELLYSISGPSGSNTPWLGGVDTSANISGGVRLNSGGYFFESNIVTFDLADGVVIINPVPEPSSLWFLLAGGFFLLSCGFFQRGRTGQKRLATPSR